MVTVVNPTTPKESNNVGLIVGALILLLAVMMIVFYGLPALSRVGNTTPMQQETTVEQAAPNDEATEGESSLPTWENPEMQAPEVTIPDEINVNVSNPEQPQE